MIEALLSDKFVLLDERGKPAIAESTTQPERLAFRESCHIGGERPTTVSWTFLAEVFWSKWRSQGVQMRLSNFPNITTRGDLIFVNNVGGNHSHNEVFEVIGKKGNRLLMLYREVPPFDQVAENLAFLHKLITPLDLAYPTWIEQILAPHVLEMLSPEDVWEGDQLSPAMSFCETAIDPALKRVTALYCALCEGSTVNVKTGRRRDGRETVEMLDMINKLTRDELTPAEKLATIGSRHSTLRTRLACSLTFAPPSMYYWYYACGGTAVFIDPGAAPEITAATGDEACIPKLTHHGVSPVVTNMAANWILVP